MAQQLRRVNQFWILDGLSKSSAVQLAPSPVTAQYTLQKNNFMTSLTGKVAIVTGSSRGIGRAIAERLGKEGASVVVNYGRSANQAQEVVSAVEANGGKGLAVQADISQVADIRRLFQEAVDHFGQLDILVNNAGTGVFQPLAEVTEEEYDATFALNTKGTFFALQEAARRMGDGGRIVNISTGLTSMSGSPSGSVYIGSKGAVEQFTKVLAKELGGRGITVNTLSPGTTETDLFNQSATEEMKTGYTQMTALGRLGQPADIADVVAFLVSEQARWITGRNILADGGLA